MANPAELLHAQLTAWSNTRTQSVRKKRGLDDPGKAAEIWRQHRRAVQLLIDTESALEVARDQAINVAVFDTYIPQWTQAIFAFPNGWISDNAQAVLKNPLDQLASAAAVLASVVPEFKPDGGIEGFDAFLTALVEEVNQLGDDHRFLKEHSLRIIRHLKGCFDDVAVFGEFRIVDALAELQTIINMLDEVTNHENPFFKKAKDGAWSFFTRPGKLALMACGVMVHGALSEAGADFYTELVAPRLPEAIETAKSMGISMLELPASTSED